MGWDPMDQKSKKSFYFLTLGRILNKILQLNRYLQSGKFIFTYLWYIILGKNYFIRYNFEELAFTVLLLK